MKNQILNQLFIFRADFVLPEVSYCDYVWDNLDNHAHLPGLVCGVSGKVVLHGEVSTIVGIFQMYNSSSIGSRASSSDCKIFARFGSEKGRYSWTHPPQLSGVSSSSSRLSLPWDHCDPHQPWLYST